MKNKKMPFIATLVAMTAVAITFIVHACILALKYSEK